MRHFAEYQAWRHEPFKIERNLVVGSEANIDHWTLLWHLGSTLASPLLDRESLNLSACPLSDRNRSSSPSSVLLCQGIHFFESLKKLRGVHWKLWLHGGCIRQVTSIRTNIFYFCHPSPKGRTRHRPRPYYPEQTVTCRPYGGLSRSSGRISQCSTARLSPLASGSSLGTLSPSFV